MIHTDLLLAWLHVESDLCTDIDQLEVVSPDGARWLTVYGFRRWTLPGQRRRTHAQAWSRISCLVTALGSGPQLAEELLERYRGDVSSVWESDTLDLFLGEHGWRDTSEIELKSNINAGIRTPYAGIDASLDAEGSSKDNSVDEGFSLCLPSSGAIKVLDLHLRSGRAPEYVDAGGTVRWQDPSLCSHGSGASIVSRDYFLEKLASAGLEPVWVLAGEKNVYAGQDLGGSGGYGGGLYHTTAFAMDAGTLKSFGTKIEFHAPSADQLERLKAESTSFS